MGKRSPVVELACLLRDDALNRERIKNLEELGSISSELKETNEKNAFLQAEVERLVGIVSSKDISIQGLRDAIDKYSARVYFAADVLREIYEILPPDWTDILKKIEDTLTNMGRDIPADIVVLKHSKQKGTKREHSTTRRSSKR